MFPARNSQAANWPYACAVDANGKLLSAGFYTYSGGEGFALVRSDTNGALDTTFNKTGIVTTKFSSNFAKINAIALQSNGDIVVAGWAEATGGATRLP